ncbi:ABC-three component system protein [Paraburkholderia sp. RL17-337-BIB-A]|uniref:ABC-three component system protein n=1 Tax=Paraburkholderia sp. RL17-337-BIB-A TaxID=3031636 RepID=UPI0038BBE249
MSTEDELTYVEELVALYAEQGSAARTVGAIMQTLYAEHFTDCRVEFYCAEGLKRLTTCAAYRHARALSEQSRRVLTEPACLSW